MDEQAPPHEVAVTHDALVNDAEINQQIATAHRFPRNITTFLREARQLVTLNEATAEQCVYALPRDDKIIEGPSARFAEVVAYAWRNLRIAARVVKVGDEFLTSQGLCHDLERNVAIAFEVDRRISGKNKKRYSADMIAVTANAAGSIALRNAVLKVVPKALWEPLYAEARKVVAGDAKTLANRRADALKAFTIFGVKPEQIYAKLGIQGQADITLDHLVALFGILTSLKEGELKAEEAFAVEAEPRRMPQPTAPSPV